MHRWRRNLQKAAVHAKSLYITRYFLFEHIYGYRYIVSLLLGKGEEVFESIRLLWANYQDKCLIKL